MKNHIICLVIVVALSAVKASAVPVMDGTRDAEYGAALSVQNTNTQFGDAANGDVVNGGNGSEIDAVYAKIVSSRLYIFVAGNLETNFNKLDIFFDAVSGGVNRIDGVVQPRGVEAYSSSSGGFAPPYGFNTDNVGSLQRMNGLTFDSGFNADYYLAITHGFEGNIDGAGSQLYAASAHYAKLSDPAHGVIGSGQALGMQLAPKGLPNVLRGTTADFEPDGDADGNDFLTWQRNVGATGVNRKSGDASSDGAVGPEDLTTWQAAYGFQRATAPYNANYFAPFTLGVDNSTALVGPSLTGLMQGQLIDRAYAEAHPGLTPELNFPLGPITPGNPENRRDMQNTVGLEMAIDNSNIGGVTAAGFYGDPTTANPATVTTGVEFSIPLTAIGNPGSAAQIKIFMAINGTGHDYLSNQFAGAGILDANLGGNGFGGYTGDLSGANMTDYVGDQFVTISVPSTAAGSAIPEPCAATLIGLAIVGLTATRRRRSQ